MTTKTAPAKATENTDVRVQREGVISRIPGWVWAVGFIGLGLTITGYAYAGIRWALPGVPSWAGAIAGFMLIWLAAAAAVELLHRNRRHIARHAARGITTTYSAARARSAPLWQRVMQWAGQRWRDRHGSAASEPAPGPAGEETSVTPVAGDAPPGGDQMTTTDPRDQMDLRDVEDSGLSRPDTGDRPAHGPRTVRGVPALWRQLADAITEFEPEGHEEFLAFLAGGINGFAALSQSYLAVYEHCRDVRKLSQQSVGALEDTADAVSDCMTALANARQKYLTAYDPAAEVAEEHGLPTRAREFFGPES